jgi:hypothetical protein
MLKGGEVTVAGSGTNFTVNGESVVCGNVQTSNVTVYMVDTVLMPQSWAPDPHRFRGETVRAPARSRLAGPLAGAAAEPVAAPWRVSV